MDEALDRALYPSHPYGRPVLGTVEHIKNPSLSKMYEFYRRHYVPNNMAVVLSGDFEPAQALSVIEKYFSRWESRPLPAARTWPLLSPRGVERVSVSYNSEEKLEIAWPVVPVLDPDAEALEVMDGVMDNSVAGIINIGLVQAQKIKAAGSLLDLADEAGSWTLWALPKRGQTLEEAESLLMDAARRLKEGDFNDDDVRAVITNLEVSEKRRLESNESRAQRMVDSFGHFEPWPYVVEHLERLRRVTKADVLRVAKKYLAEGRVVAYRREGEPQIPAIEKPHFTPIAIDAKRESRFASEILAIPAPPLEPRWLAAGRDYQISDLPWGRLYVSPNPVNDIFSIDFEFERGSRDERDLCAAFALLDFAGVGSLSPAEYERRLYALGTTISTHCDERESGVSLTGSR